MLEKRACHCKKLYVPIYTFLERFLFLTGVAFNITCTCNSWTWTCKHIHITWKLKDITWKLKDITWKLKDITWKLKDITWKLIHIVVDIDEFKIGKKVLRKAKIMWCYFMRTPLYTMQTVKIVLSVDFLAKFDTS